MFKCS